MKRNRKGMTFVEILLVVTIIAILAIGAIVLINPKTQIDRAIDTRRRKEFDVFKKVMEDYYNDKGCYPTPLELCYTGGDNGTLIGKKSCFVCGTVSSSPSFSPYINPLICDPLYAQKKYLYVVDNTTCPTWFKMYANLNIPNDEVCGKGGCGIKPIYGYDYAVSSPNVDFDATPYFYCLTTTNTCDNCNAYEDCKSNAYCVKIFSTIGTCCASTPKPIGCM